MRKALMLAAASALVLAACSPERADEQTYSDKAAEVELIQPVPDSRAVEAVAPEASPQPRLQVRAPSALTLNREAGDMQDASPARPTPEPQRIAEPRPAPFAPVARIAYAFSYVVALPKERGPELMSRHEFACVTAGAGLCQMVAAQADWTTGNPGGRLEMRGQPDWINQFRARLALDAANVGGALEEAATVGEDVTRGIDEAQTGAKTTATLADRIRELQQRRGGSLAQQMEIERQLAELQRLQDRQEIELRELNGRVQSAILTIHYREGGVMSASSPTRPVAKALQNAFGLSMGMLAVLITTGSVLLPIAVIGGAVWWATVRRRRKAPMPA